MYPLGSRSVLEIQYPVDAQIPIPIDAEPNSSERYEVAAALGTHQPQQEELQAHSLDFILTVTTIRSYFD